MCQHFFTGPTLWWAGIAALKVFQTVSSFPIFAFMGSDPRRTNAENLTSKFLLLIAFRNYLCFLIVWINERFKNDSKKLQFILTSKQKLKNLQLFDIMLSNWCYQFNECYTKNNWKKSLYKCLNVREHNLIQSSCKIHGGT